MPHYTVIALLIISQDPITIILSAHQAQLIITLTKPVSCTPEARKLIEAKRCTHLDSHMLTLVCFKALEALQAKKQINSLLRKCHHKYA